MLNKLLLRQLKKHLPSFSQGEEFELLLAVISESYDHYEKDRKMLERSIELSSVEMIELHERLRQEANLAQDAHKELQLMFENIDEVFFTVDVEKSKVTRMSAACESVYGYCADDFFHDADLWIKVVYEEDLPLINDNYPLLLAGKSLKTEHRIIHKDGSIRWIETKITPTLNSAGKLIRLDGVTNDISEKKYAVNQLEKSEIRFRSLIEHNEEGIFLCDEKCNVIYQSPSVVRLTGYSSDEFINRSGFLLVHPEEKETSQQTFELVLSNPGTPIPFQHRILNKEGNSLWIEGKATNLLNDENVKAIVVNFRDITIQKNNQERIQASETRFRSLIENSADMISMADSNGQFLYVSPEVIKKFGYTSEEFLKMKVADLIHPEDLSNANLFANSSTHPPMKPVDCTMIRNRTKSGNYIWVEGTTTNLLHLNGVNAIVSNFRDVTNRKYQEETLLIRNEELSKTNLELDKFVYSVSHDLRAPLSSMLGIIEISKEDSSEPLILEHMGFLEERVKKLDGFILDILNYSRNARQPIKKEQINFESIFEEVNNNLKFMSSGKKINLDFALNADAPYFGDPGRLLILLNNLVSNGIRYQNPKATEPNVKISVEVCQLELKLKVSDNGIGIKEEQQSKIFDMSYRVSENSVGSGLGLYLVKEIVEKCNGKIKVDSKLGAGTTFTIVMPNFDLYN